MREMETPERLNAQEQKEPECIVEDELDNPESNQATSAPDGSMKPETIKAKYDQQQEPGNMQVGVKQETDKEKCIDKHEEQSHAEEIIHFAKSPSTHHQQPAASAPDVLLQDGHSMPFEGGLATSTSRTPVSPAGAHVGAEGAAVAASDGADALVAMEAACLASEHPNEAAVEPAASVAATSEAPNAAATDLVGSVAAVSEAPSEAAVEPATVVAAAIEAASAAATELVASVAVVDQAPSEAAVEPATVVAAAIRASIAAATELVTSVAVVGEAPSEVAVEPATVVAAPSEAPSEAAVEPATVVAAAIRASIAAATELVASVAAVGEAPSEAAVEPATAVAATSEAPSAAATIEPATSVAPTTVPAAAVPDGSTDATNAATGQTATIDAAFAAINGTGVAAAGPGSSADPNHCADGSPVAGSTRVPQTPPTGPTAGTPGSHGSGPQLPPGFTINHTGTHYQFTLDCSACGFNRKVKEHSKMVFALDRHGVKCSEWSHLTPSFFYDVDNRVRKHFKRMAKGGLLRGSKHEDGDMNADSLEGGYELPPGFTLTHNKQYKFLLDCPSCGFKRTGVHTRTRMDHYLELHRDSCSEWATLTAEQFYEGNHLREHWKRLAQTVGPNTPGVDAGGEGQGQGQAAEASGSAQKPKPVGPRKSKRTTTPKQETDAAPKGRKARRKKGETTAPTANGTTLPEQEEAAPPAEQHDDGGVPPTTEGHTAVKIVDAMAQQQADMTTTKKDKDTTNQENKDETAPEKIEQETNDVVQAEELCAPPPAGQVDATPQPSTAGMAQHADGPSTSDAVGATPEGRVDQKNETKAGSSRKGKKRPRWDGTGFPPGFKPVRRPDGTCTIYIHCEKCDVTRSAPNTSRMTDALQRHGSCQPEWRDLTPEHFYDDKDCLREEFKAPS